MLILISPIKTKFSPLRFTKKNSLAHELQVMRLKEVEKAVRAKVIIEKSHGEGSLMEQNVF